MNKQEQQIYFAERIARNKPLYNLVMHCLALEDRLSLLEQYPQSGAAGDDKSPATPKGTE